MIRSISSAAALALCLAAPALADIGTPAGIAGAVSGSVGLVSPAKQITAPIALRSGDDIVMGDNLATASDSRLQVMLLDESAITLGPDAQLTIDEFVFDPADTNEDLLAATLLKGAFRLVTGGIARENPEGTTLNLPNAVLTIRGTTVIGACEATCVVALAGSGEANNAGKKPSTVTLRTARGEVTLKRAGFYVEIDAEGNISPPERLTDAIDQRFAGLFPRLGDPGRIRNADFVQHGRSLLEASGQPLQEGRPLAVNQREFDIADRLDGRDRFETTTNLPINQEINYANTAGIGFGGASQDGDIFFSATLNIAKRDFSGSVLIDHTDIGFQDTFALAGNPFNGGGLTLSQSGEVLDPTIVGDTYSITYSITRQFILISDFQYDIDGAGTTAPSDGIGIAPAVP